MFSIAKSLFVANKGIQISVNTIEMTMSLYSYFNMEKVFTINIATWQQKINGFIIKQHF